MANEAAVGVVNKSPQDNPWFDHETRREALSHAVAWGASVTATGEAVVATAERFRKFLTAEGSE